MTDDALHLYVDTLPRSLDGLDTESYAQWTVVYNLASRLFEYGPKGELVPALVERHEVSADGLEHVLHLHPDRLFADGSRVSAADVAYSLGLSLASRKSYSHLADLVAPDGVTVLSDTAVAVRARRPGRELLEALNYNENGIRSAAAAREGRLVYGGAYVPVENAASGGGELELRLNPHHPAAASGAYPRILVRRLPASAAHYRTLLETGRTAIVGRGTLSFTSRFGARGDWTTYVFAAGNTYVLVLRTGLAHGAYVKWVMQSIFRRDAVLRKYRYMREQDSFYPRGMALHAPVALRPVPRPADPVHVKLKLTRGLLFPELIERIRTLAAEAGVILDLVEVDESLRPGFRDGDDSDAFLASCYVDTQEPLHIAKAYFTGDRSLVGELPPHVAQVLARAETATRRSDRLAFLRQLYHMIFSELDALPLFFAPNAVLTSRDVDVSDLDFYANTVDLARFRPLPEDADEDEARADEAGAGPGADVRMIAHDLRKPFTLVRAFHDVVRNVADPARLPALCDSFGSEMQRAVTAADLMIKDLLEDPRRRGGERPDELALASPRALVRDAVAEARATADGAGAGCEVAYDFAHAELVEVDRAKIHRVLLNLVQNALQAMSPPSGTCARLWLRTATVVTDAGGYVEVVVGNSHSYIAPEDMSRIFKPWFTKGKANGTGLGLAIVRKLVRAHGGELSVRSDAQRGTEFAFTLPVAPGTKDEESLAAAEPARAANAPGAACAGDAGLPVAIVDDNIFLLEAWEARLGAGALTFASPAAFFAAAEERGLDAGTLRCVITDFHFDDAGTATGLDVARWVRAHRPGLPVLLCSESGGAGQADLFHGVIDKDPLDAAALDRRLQEIAP